MNVVDHRILIPRSPDAVWDYISDLAHNPEWQVDCTTISFLSSRRSGAGVRWRYATRQGREYVAETTAWYDKLGYEYTFVDGAPFRESKGRIRLQEIAEGTVVQWTFNYEVGGFFGGMRNAVTLKRQIESALIDSLKMLWKVIQEATANEREREIKSLMRDAPDYEARSTYKSRHPSKQAQPMPDTAPPQPIQIVEPPISDEDTRPRAPVKVATEEHAVVAQPETEAPEPVETHSPYAPPEVVEASNPVRQLQIEEMSDEVPEPVPSVIINIPNDDVVDVPAVTLSRDLIGLATTEEDPIVEVEEPEESREVAEVEVPSELQEKPTEIIAAPVLTQEQPMPVVKGSTAEVSVFDLFGIPRPSQAQELAPVDLPTPTPAPPVTKKMAAVGKQPEAVSISTQRIGMRLQLRRKQVKLRRPS